MEDAKTIATWEAATQGEVTYSQKAVWEVLVHLTTSSKPGWLRRTLPKHAYHEGSKEAYEEGAMFLWHSMPKNAKVKQILMA